MKRASPITCMFLDIGGVLLTDGWDHHARKRAATNFELEFSEMEDRHHLNFYTYEEGKLTLEEYLSRVVFYQERSFTRAQFRRFMFAQSKPFALDFARTPAGQIVYIENTPMFVQIAEGLGIRSILHTDYMSTRAKLASFGLHNDEGVIHETC
ncbi:MAG: HAD family phosphatase [Rhizomicrobium sp.]